MPPPTIAQLAATPTNRIRLAHLLIETVAHGGSVSFMHPLSRQDADHFWNDAFEAAARNERIILGAIDNDTLAGTVTLQLTCPPNQPHRAEISKLMTRHTHRGQGIAAALMRAAESLAVQHNKTLLVLDTAADGGAAGLYDSLGYTRAGEIPDYALKPHGGLTATIIYWKRIGNVAQDQTESERTSF